MNAKASKELSKEIFRPLRKYLNEKIRASFYGVSQKKFPKRWGKPAGLPRRPGSHLFGNFF
jgi:hypothetical protein